MFERQPVIQGWPERLDAAHRRLQSKQCLNQAVARKSAEHNKLRLFCDFFWTFLGRVASSGTCGKFEGLWPEGAGGVASTMADEWVIEPKRVDWYKSIDQRVSTPMQHASHRALTH